MAPPASLDWSGAQAALKVEVERVGHLLRSVRNPDAEAIGGWTAADVAMHLSQTWMAVPGLAAHDLSAVHEVVPELEGAAGASLIHELWDLGGVTQLAVRSDPERTLAVLADRIAERAEAYLAAIGEMSSDEPRPWLVEGTQVASSTLTFHLLNETIVHGWDIAHADGQRWTLDRSHAALAFDGFLVPVFQALGPRELVDQAAAAGLRATYEIRVRGGARHVFAFDDGELTVEAPSDRPVDCHISGDPSALLLVAWARRSQWPAIARGQIVAWGRKPWLGPRFRGLLRNT